MWWCLPFIPALQGQRQRQADLCVEVSQGYIVIPCLKINKQMTRVKENWEGFSVGITRTKAPLDFRPVYFSWRLVRTPALRDGNSCLSILSPPAWTENSQHSLARSALGHLPGVEISTHSHVW